MSEYSHEFYPEWTDRATIYEVNLRQYSLSGSLSVFESHLPRLKEMGIDILWFMPVTPIGIEDRKMGSADLGSYYAVKNYYQFSHEFGTMEEWKLLVSKMHDMGFKVIIDWVANHTAPDHPWTTFHTEFYIRDDSGKILPPNSDWTDTRQLDFNNGEMRTAMIDAMSYWIRETDIDGFRCDMAKLIPPDFWSEAIKKLRTYKDILFIAEGEDQGYYQAGFNAQYTWSLFHALTDLYRGNKSLDDILQIINSNESLGPGFRLTFTSNHDENTWNGTEADLFGDAVKCFTVLNFTMNEALPMIYSGQETGNKKRLSFFTKDVIAWDSFERSEFYKSLISLRKTHISFNINSTNQRVATSNDTCIYSYLKEYQEDKVLIILNMSKFNQQISICEQQAFGKVVNYFTNEEITLNIDSSIKLDSWGYLIFTYPTL